MTIIQKELAWVNSEIGNFVNVRNTYLEEVSKLKQFRSIELLKAAPSQKIVAVLSAEIKEREDVFNAFIMRAVEMLHFRDRLNGVYHEIVKPYGFNWKPIENIVNLWSPTKFNSSNKAYSGVGKPFFVKRVNLFSNILPLPFDETSYSIMGTGYMQPIRVADSNGLQSIGDILRYNDVEVTIEEKLLGQSFNVLVMGVSKPNVAASSGLYITSIAGDSIDGFQEASEDPEDEGETGIEMHFTAIYEKNNFPYIFPQQIFTYNGKVATQLYSWLPYPKYIF